tara:strand:- start:144 stop:404 length:261 start_codon:yes stop_codon:yes gene_type:complete
MTELITEDKHLYLSMNDEHKAIVLKGWESMTGWYWLATELNDDGVHFGYVQGTYPEWGYFSEQELDSIPSVWKIKDIDLPYAGRRD